MADMQIPLVKGVGRDHKYANYIDLIPVNMLAVSKQVLNANGYLRSMPGIKKMLDVVGISRGVELNTVKNIPYRVCGEKLYAGGEIVADLNLPGGGRVSMAHSANSQAVADDGIMYLARYDGTIKQLDNWPPDSGKPSYEIGRVLDICRHRSRYAWVKEGGTTFGVTDLTDESHPDQFRPFYSAESTPDLLVGIAEWRDFIVTFGTSTIEYFTLTGSSSTSDPIYISQSSMVVNMGIAGTHCKCPFLQSFAILSNPSSGASSIYIVQNGSAVSIATDAVEQIIAQYTTEQLSTVVLESTRFSSHELLLVHLPNHTLCYDATASKDIGPQWCLLKSGLYDEVYQAIDFVFNGSLISVGDKFSPVTGTLDPSIAAQYDVQQEHLLYTPLIKADNAIICDFELETVGGLAPRVEQLFLSATTDGAIYGQEKLIEYDAPFNYDRRVLWRRIGRCRKNIGFKIRAITTTPVTFSNCHVRVE